MNHNVVSRTNMYTPVHVVYTIVSLPFIQAKNGEHASKELRS